MIPPPLMPSRVRFAFSSVLFCEHFVLVSKRTRFWIQSGDELVLPTSRWRLIAGSSARMLGIASLRRSEVPL